MGVQILNKLNTLYYVMDNFRKIGGIRSDVDINIDYNGKNFNRTFTFFVEKRKEENKKKSIKITKSKSAYTMMGIDLLDRVKINEGSSKKIITLKVGSFNELPAESREIIVEHMQQSKGGKDKVHYLTDMMSNGSSISEILSLLKEFKKLDLSMKDIEPNSFSLEIEVDNNLNILSLRFNGVGKNIDNNKPVSIDFKEKFID